MIDENFLIDSNILIYALDISDKIKHNIARKILEECIKGDKVVTISSQNLAEFFVVITSKTKNKISMEDAQTLIESMITIENFRKVNYAANTVYKATKLVEKNNIEFWDALIAATMIENNIKTIYTENVKDFEKIKEINVINPFN